MYMMRGKCLGVAERERGKSGNTWTVTMLGLSLTKNDLFQSDYVVELQLSDDQMKNGMLQTLQENKGKMLTVEFWQKVNARDSKIYINYYLVDIIPMKAKPDADKR